ncbi:MAG: MFS transporter [Armatimonadetes bacterium]|nr:MFS transporter [Armatimonadota bacterium]
MNPTLAPPKNRAALALICSAVMLLYSLYLGSVGILLPALGKTFGLGAEIQGRLFPASFFGFVAAVLVCGYLSDKKGRKAVLLFGCALYSFGLILFGLAPTYSIALFASFAVGAGSGVMEVVASALAADLYPEKRTLFLNAIQVVFGVGAALGPSISRGLMAHGTDWRTLYLGLAAVNGVLFVSLLFYKVPRADTSESLHISALLAVLRKPAFGVLCLMQALYVGAEVSFFSWMPTYFDNRVIDGAKWAGLVVTVFWVAMTAGRMVNCWLIHHVRLMRLTLISAVGGAIFSALTLSTQDPHLVMACVAVVGFCYSGIFSLVLSEAGDRFTSVAGTAFGGVMAMGGIGGAILPWVVGFLSTTKIGWNGALMTVPAVLIVLAILAKTLENTSPHPH